MRSHSQERMLLNRIWKVYYSFTADLLNNPSRLAASWYNILHFNIACSSRILLIHSAVSIDSMQSFFSVRTALWPIHCVLCYRSMIPMLVVLASVHIHFYWVSHISISSSSDWDCFLSRKYSPYHTLFSHQQVLPVFCNLSNKPKGQPTSQPVALGVSTSTPRSKYVFQSTELRETTRGSKLFPVSDNIQKGE